MLQLIQQALRRPITILVVLIGLVAASFLTIRKMPIDIFPNLSLPTIYVAQPYGGLSPQQVEALITSYYEYHFLYVTGVKYVDSKSVQGVSLVKIEFQEGTNMAQAMGEVVGYVNRSRAFMPPGTVPPFIARFDAGSVPVGQLVFRSEGRSLGEIQDLALFKVRPMFSTLPGVSAPPPFGGNQKTVLIRADPERLQSYHISPDELIAAIAKGNSISPAGNLRVGNQTLTTPMNTMVDNIRELETIPVQTGSGESTPGPTVYVRDLAQVELGSDITTGYALIDGKRSVYLNVSKRSDASTWQVVQAVKKALPDMQAAIPDDIKVSYEFDQSGYVINSLTNLLIEGGLGAILTGLMVLLFLSDRRSAAIVVLTIPLALLSGVIGLYLTGQTLNIMTLGGLALAVGILVDEATVTIENIHRHLEEGEPKAQAIWLACREIAGPKLLILLSILTVFVPALFMTGVTQALFLPLSLAVGFSMIASFLLSQTLVPILANYWLKDHNQPVLPDRNTTDYRSPTKATRGESTPGESTPGESTPGESTPGESTPGRFARFQVRFERVLTGLLARRSWVVPLYVGSTFLLTGLIYWGLGTDIFPKTTTNQFQVRLRLPTGTRVECTEAATQQVLTAIRQLAGPQGVAISSAFVGTQPSSYPINTIYLWTSGPHEAVLKVNLTEEATVAPAQFADRLRAEMKQRVPDLRLSFEAGNLVDQVINLGATNPIEIAVVGKNLTDGRKMATRLQQRLAGLTYLRDVQIATPLDYPSLQLTIDRVRAGQLGMTASEIGQSLVTTTSSSRFVQPNYWIDQAAGNAYQVQVDIPPYQLTAPESIEQIPVRSAGAGGNAQSAGVTLREVADWKRTTTVGEYDRLNQQRYVTITANVGEGDLGRAVADIKQEITGLGELPKGLKISLRGQAELLGQTLGELQAGLLLAIGVIFLLLAASFQSFRLAVVGLSTVPAVLAGSLGLLWITGQTLNIQSFMGCIMALGVAIANAILLLTNAQTIRQQSPERAALTGATTRLRPILMTSLAMIAGMIPMASGLGEGGGQTAPLGIAVIGGLFFSTVSTLLMLPLVYRSMIGVRPSASSSLDPTDPDSLRYVTPSQPLS
ncbi:efflux RND transporter permease subunit [Spirosoma utsteinense]|uniref:efflux RND transporter permease subunit n=1 Tax=Spirosoma utsteinense TaxID=2585773 RepID=UPI001648847E|nr:efflux RND transporter permease subunit [Spirosoma utsteinense]MBC3788440.1 multidrug efflux pump subunit AcrB [Spirosoma utsteinense]